MQYQKKAVLPSNRSIPLETDPAPCCTTCSNTPNHFLVHFLNVHFQHLRRTGPLVVPLAVILYVHCQSIIANFWYIFQCTLKTDPAPHCTTSTCSTLLVHCLISCAGASQSIYYTCLGHQQLGIRINVKFEQYMFTRCTQHLNQFFLLVLSLYTASSSRFITEKYSTAMCQPASAP